MKRREILDLYNHVDKIGNIIRARIKENTLNKDEALQFLNDLDKEYFSLLNSGKMTESTPIPFSLSKFDVEIGKMLREITARVKDVPSWSITGSRNNIYKFIDEIQFSKKTEKSIRFYNTPRGDENEFLCMFYPGNIRVSGEFQVYSSPWELYYMLLYKGTAEEEMLNKFLEKQDGKGNLLKNATEFYKFASNHEENMRHAGYRYDYLEDRREKDTQRDMLHDPIRRKYQEVSEKNMFFALKCKFEPMSMRRKLLDTGDHYLVFENDVVTSDSEWGIARYYSSYDRIGKNKLGIVMMDVRDEYRRIDEESKKQKDYYNLPVLPFDHKMINDEVKKVMIKTKIQHKINNQNRQSDTPFTLFTIENFLTKKECQSLIDCSEKMKYSSIEWEYDPAYRNATRVVTVSDVLSQAMWKRLMQNIDSSDIADIRPFGFGNEGTWTPFCVNECIRFTKYTAGQFFKPHKDGSFVRNNENRSIWTIMVYLNDTDSFKGGNTTFYSAGELGDHEEQDKQNVKLEVVHEQTPKTGMAVIFNHDLNHEGGEVTQGWKYILRTDVMFRRIDRDTFSEKTEFRSNPYYIQAEELYQLSIKLQKEGDPLGSTKAYLRAQELQAKLPSVKSKLGPEYDWLPIEVYRKITGYLDNCDLLKMASISRSWKSIALESQVWRDRYLGMWPHSIKAQQSALEDPKAITSDWYSAFKYRFFSESLSKISVIHIAHNMTYMKQRSGYCIFPSLVGKYTGHYWSADSGKDRYVIGNAVRMDRGAYSNFLGTPYLKGGHEIDPLYFPIYIEAILEEHSHHDPILFVKPYWMTKHHLQIFLDVLNTNHHYSVGILDDYACISYYLDVKSAIIVCEEKSVPYEVALVIDHRLIKVVNVESEGESKKVVEEITKEYPNIAKKEINHCSSPKPQETVSRRDYGAVEGGHMASTMPSTIKKYFWFIDEQIPNFDHLYFQGEEGEGEDKDKTTKDGSNEQKCSTF
eukprot:TRINITY_DN2454_c0_g1_i2.p1 TRINITY_DN2454_c0_g1~~TRINITY_DN2454_c0_g1_i2.p1  ORF type:complete len:975 (-),score=208.94 TRINITY_DN2454_c0_g1_i2:42-2966(-)